MNRSPFSIDLGNAISALAICDRKRQTSTRQMVMGHLTAESGVEGESD
ncbi:MAG: hypothetical protein AAFP20_19535 [Cyanobacteria bacterium J06614_10]